MSSETVRNTVRRWISLVFMIAITGAFGASPDLAVAKAAGAMSQSQVEMAVQVCQHELSGVGAAMSCDGREVPPASKTPCPMMGGPCVNMAAGAPHCVPFALMYITGIQAATPTVETAKYLRTELQATGLPTEPLFQPPIL